MGEEMNKLILSFVTILVYVSQISAIGQEWSSRYNGAGNSLDWAYDIEMDPFGFVVITGYSTGAGTGKDYKTIKYNPSGAIIWEATYAGPINGGDYSNVLCIDNTGNIYVTGRVDFGTTGSDIVTIKYNSAGVQQWTARYNGSANGLDEGRTITVTDEGSVIVGGKTTSTTGGLDFVTIKYNADGSEAWATVYNGSGNNEDYVTGLDVDENGNIYTGGCSIGAGSGQDIVLIKYNSAGTQQWLKRYNGTGNGGDAVIGVKVDGSNNVVTGGYTDNGSAQRMNFIALKYDQAGTLLWERQYNGSSNATDLATAMTIDGADNVYLTGLTTQLFGSRLDSNYGTIKYDPSGNLQWAVFYDGPGNSVDLSRSIFVDNAMNVYITGSSKGIGSDDYATIKYSPSGAQLWVMSYNGTGNSNDYSSSVIADNSGNAYVTGRSVGAGSDFDYATIKYGDLVGIQAIGNEIPDRFMLSQNYPNPFNPETKIRFSIPEQQNVTISVYDALGRQLKNDVLGSLSPAVYEYSFKGIDFTSGIYFYRLTTNKFVDTKKMIMLK